MQRSKSTATVFVFALFYSWQLYARIVGDLIHASRSPETAIVQDFLGDAQQTGALPVPLDIRLLARVRLFTFCDDNKHESIS